MVLVLSRSRADFLQVWNSPQVYKICLSFACITSTLVRFLLNQFSFNLDLGSAWECHPGCKRFCLSSCKRSCCMPGAPNYNPSMFNQLVSYQASLPAPPPPPPACPVGCPGSCYPSCDSGCCFQASQPSFPQYPANPYDVGYVGYPAGDPCATQGCSASCAPLCKPG